MSGSKPAPFLPMMESSGPPPREALRPAAADPSVAGLPARRCPTRRQPRRRRACPGPLRRRRCPPHRTPPRSSRRRRCCGTAHDLPVAAGDAASTPPPAAPSTSAPVRTSAASGAAVPGQHAGPWVPARRHLAQGWGGQDHHGPHARAHLRQSPRGQGGRPRRQPGCRQPGPPHAPGDQPHGHRPAR